MNFKKLLTLSAAALMVGTTAVGCNNADKETLSAAAEYLWQMYRNTDETKVTGSFDVVNKVSVGDQIVSVTWAIEATGSKEAFAIEAKNENFSTVKVGYYDGLVTEDSTVKLVPTFTLGKTSLTLADVYADEEAKHAIDFTTPVLKLNNHADWDKNDGALLNIRGVVVDVIKTGSSSNSIYMVDAEGNGYYVYNPSTKGAKVGDEIVVTGTRSDYSGQEEFAKNGTYGIVKTGQQASINFVNASADWAAASSNKSTGDLGAKYQNTPVKLEKCTPTRISGSYYYFKVGNGTTEYNVYKNTYFLTDEQTAAWVAMFEDALAKGYTLTIEGISTVYSSAYQIYPCSLKANVFTKEAELSTEEKHALVAKTLTDSIATSYKKATKIELPALPSYATVNSVTVTSPTEAATAVVEEGKIVVTPTPTATTNTVKVNVTIGGVAKDVELTIKTEAKIDPSLFMTEQIAYKDVTVGQDTEITAKNSDDVEAKVTVKATGVEESSGDWKIGAGDTVLVTAPEGYVIDKVEVDSNGNYNSLNFYSSADKAEGTKFDDDTLSDENDPHSNQYRENNDGRTLTTIPVNGATFLISNDTPSYNVYSKGFVVTLKKLPEVIKSAEFNFSNLTATGTSLTNDAALELFQAYLGANAEQLESVVVSKVYDGNGSGGAYPNTPGLLKFGASKDKGEVTLTFAEGVEFTKVEILCHEWNKKSDSYPNPSNKVSVNGSEQVYAPYNETGAPEVLTFDIEASNTINIEVSNRMYCFSIKLS